MTAMMILGLPLLDILVIIAYFAVVLWIGFRAMKRVRNSDDYFLAGRRFGRSIQTFAAFGQGTSAETAVTTTTMVSTNGAAGVGMGLFQGLILMPVMWMTTMWYRRMRYLSLAEFFSERYGSRRMAGFYAAAQAVLFMIVAAGGFAAMSKTIAAIADKPVAALSADEAAERSLAVELRGLKDKDYRLLTPAEQSRIDELSKQNPSLAFSYIDRTWLTICLAVIVLLYAVSGGLEAAFITDMIQGIFILILTVMLIPFAMAKINAVYGKEGFMGTFEAFHDNLPDSFFQVLGSPNLPQFTWYYLLAFAVMGVINTAVQANQLTAAGSAKDDETARVGFLNGIFIKRYCSVIWGFLAMMTLLLYGDKVADPDYVWGLATRELLPTGLVGLMIACLMAALMSTADALMLTSSSLLTNSVYRPLVPEKSEEHYVFIGRIFCVVYIVGGVWIALALDDIFTLFILMLSFNAMLGAAFWMGMIWRRATRPAAWMSILVTFVLTLALPFLLPMIPGVRNHEGFAKQTRGFTVENQYNANAADVEKRAEEIALWETLSARGEAEGLRPEPLTLGERFTKHDYIRPQSIFWQNGLSRDGEGRPVGAGMLKVELVLLDLLGIDLSANKHALNESLTAILRVLVPFAILIGISLVTRREDKERLDFFFARLRTKVNADHDVDAVEVEKTRLDPARMDHLRLFPGSDWEFRKWTRRDWFGQCVVVAAAAGVLLLLWAMVALGKT